MKSARETDIGALFDAWNMALKTGDPDRVAELYAPDAVLLPTFSCAVRHNGAEIREYFVRFLEHKPAGRLEESNVHHFGDTVIHSGVYAFSMSPPEGRPREMTARFTFVYHKYGDRWLIAEHHSSLLPPPDAS
jgi:uncharacterized protein (TIGR02246 family)